MSVRGICGLLGTTRGFLGLVGLGRLLLGRLFILTKNVPTLHSARTNPQKYPKGTLGLPLKEPSLYEAWKLRQEAQKGSLLMSSLAPTWRLMGLPRKLLCAALKGSFQGEIGPCNGLCLALQ